VSNEKKPVDRRSARWSQHRDERRATLVAAAVKAIDAHGPTASIADIAKVAQVSKPVLYRYFEDKDDLYRAVGKWAADEVLALLLDALLSAKDPRTAVNTACDAYLRFISHHPKVFFLLVEHRSSDDPLRDGKELIAAALARTIGDYLGARGFKTAGAEPWAHGVVGLGLAHGEWWLRRHTMSRKGAAAYLADFIWHAFDGTAREQGVELADLAGPRRPS
jgi:AcrR family transcriptional regulator